MAEFGHYALCLAWLLTVIGIVSGILAGRRRSDAWLTTAVNSTILVFCFAFVALSCLAYIFVQSDFSNQYVWQHSNRDMSAIYKITAIWGGMDGSMLLWAVLLTLSGMLVAVRANSYGRILIPWALSAVNLSSCFFLSVTVFLTNPFRYVKAEFIPPDGNGLNPLLQNPFMAIHPPTLYTGFTVLSVPFAFCFAALLSGTYSSEWIKLTRRWTLIGWSFLTAGIVLGGHWAYIELGWGGFWAWDPVENASFFPWLTATAFLHSVMVQERKNMLKMWNVWLVTLTYALTVFGTFLTRSGVVQSVHAFASSEIGPVFLDYLGGLLLVTALLCYIRRAQLRPERSIESFFSREAMFLINNLIFLSICFATIWGVLFPVLSEKITGTKQAVGIPFFNTVNIPLFMLMLLLMGVGPLIAWRKATLSSMVRMFAAPFVIALMLAILLVWVGVVSFYPVLSYALCAFVTMTILGEIHRGMKVQRAAASGDTRSLPGDFLTLFRRHRVRYGSHLVHFGVVIVTIAITASMAHKREEDFTLSRGQSYQIGRFNITLKDFKPIDNKNYQGLKAETVLTSLSDGKELAALNPEMRFYKRNKESTTEVALRMGLREDVYLVLAGLDDSETRAAFRVFINPLQVWLWFGAMIMLAGTVVVIIPSKAAVTIPAVAAERVKA